MMDKAIILVSGGMDSCVTAAIAKAENDEIALLHISYGAARATSIHRHRGFLRGRKKARRFD
jgi:7-cyano-7-deazaguanine synthase in queuosine biosynthesis